MSCGDALSNIVQRWRTTSEGSSDVAPDEKAKEATFESFDYHQSYPRMYLRYLRFKESAIEQYELEHASSENFGIDGDFSHDEASPVMASSRGTSRPRNYIRPSITAVKRAASTKADNSYALRWAMNVVIAIAVGVWSALILGAVAHLEEWRTDTLAHIVEHASSRGYGYLMGILFWLGSAALFVAFGAALVCFIEPVAGGGGIPDVIGFLNGINVPRVMNLSTFLVKSVSCICSVVGGMPVGIEAPLIHLGAIVGCGVSQGRSKTLGCQTNSWIQQFRRPRDRRDFTTAGSACGVAAAFGAPIGGLLFVMEEMASFWDMCVGGQVFMASMGCFCTLALMNGLIRTGHLSAYVSNQSAIMFEVNYQIRFNLLAIIPSVFLGVICGLLAVLFTKINVATIRWRRRVIKPLMHRKFLEPIVIVLVYCLICYLFALIAGCRTAVPPHPLNTTNSVQEFQTENVSRLVTFTCSDPEHEYSPLATLTLGMGKSNIRHMVTRRTVNEFSAAAVFIFLFLYFIGAAYTAGTAISSGMVIPMLIIGSATGRLYGIFLVNAFSAHVPQAWVPEHYATSGGYFAADAWMDPGVFALIGAGAFFGGMSRMTIAPSVIMVELSGELHFLLPIMVAIICAAHVADMLCVPLYHQNLHLDCIPYIPSSIAGLELERYTVRDIMSKGRLVTLRRKETTANILTVLQNTTHHAFPVVENDEGDLVEEMIDKQNRRKAAARRRRQQQERRVSTDSREEETGSPANGSGELTSLVGDNEQDGEIEEEGTLREYHHKNKFCGIATREDIQLLLELPAMKKAGLAEYRKHLVVMGRRDDTIISKAQENVEKSAEAYDREIKKYIEEVNKSTWTEWVAHQTSLFLSTGSSSSAWHSLWRQRHSNRDYLTSNAFGSGDRDAHLPSVVDLSLIVNLSPWIVPPFFNLQMTFTLFRQNGIRHLVVADGDRVLGMVTRKDLLPHTLRQRLEDDDDPYDYDDDTIRKGSPQNTNKTTATSSSSTTPVTTNDAPRRVVAPPEQGSKTSTNNTNPNNADYQDKQQPDGVLATSATGKREGRASASDPFGTTHTPSGPFDAFSGSPARRTVLPLSQTIPEGAREMHPPAANSTTTTTTGASRLNFFDDDDDAEWHGHTSGPHPLSS